MNANGTAAQAEAEAAIFAQCGDGGAAPSALFLLGAPRTGSTVFYQACAARFGLPYISNLTNACFGETPIVGLALQKAFPVRVGYANSFGKTDGAFQPSEGSAVLSHWFGGGHPSQTVSARILPGCEPHFLRTLAAAEALFGRPLVIKNPWNCFRAAYLAAALPRARFLWVRRDIAEAALSDLEARYVTKGTAQSWNSATPANWEALSRRPPAEQVVENQYEFNRAIGDALVAGAEGRWSEIWYEDFIADPNSALAGSGRPLGLEPVAELVIAPPPGAQRPRRVQGNDAADIAAYVRAQGARLAPHGYGPRAAGTPATRQ
jgi:hypothetical protein